MTAAWSSCRRASPPGTAWRSTSAARSPTASACRRRAPPPARRGRSTANSSGSSVFRALFFLSVLGASLLAGCAVGPNYHTPALDVPPQFAAKSAEGAAPSGATAGSPAPVQLSGWWHALQDPELDSLVQRAVDGNPDLMVALDRLQAARELEAAVLGSVLPVAQASASAARGTGSDLTRGRASQTLISADNTSGFAHINEIGGF